MEKHIKEYEKFIQEASAHPTPELRKYHQEMVANFQHERLIHLIIMLFFITLTLGLILVFAWTFAMNIINIALIAAMVLMIILSVAYVKHYYFLENHIQRLYDITSEMYLGEHPKKK